MANGAEALKKYRMVKHFQKPDSSMNVKKVMDTENKIPQREIMLANDECGVVPLKEGQSIKLMVTGLIGKPMKEGYPIRVDYCEMIDDKEKDDDDEIRPTPSA